MVRANDPTHKHDNCFYFVLDVNHDKFSAAALMAYADACRAEYPHLASDLDGIVKAARIAHGASTEGH